MHCRECLLDWCQKSPTIYNTYVNCDCCMGGHNRKKKPMAAEFKRQARAMALVTAYINERLDKSDPTPEYDVYLVWWCYILGGWKALVSTTLPDQMYYEVTYNKDREETYLDAYKKFENVCFPDTD